MRIPTALVVSTGLLLIMGCASTATTSDDTVKFHVSDRAEKLLEEQGKSLAAMRGYSRDSPLVCERFQKTGSHIKVNVCYTRKEMEARQRNHQEEYRTMSEPGAKCSMGTFRAGSSAGGNQTPNVLSGAVSRGTNGQC